MCDLLHFDALIGYPIRIVIRTVKDEAVIDRCSFRAGNERGLSRRFALRWLSTARGRPPECLASQSSFRVPLPDCILH
jgi:hypothetical protein